MLMDKINQYQEALTTLASYQQSELSLLAFVVLTILTVLSPILLILSLVSLGVWLFSVLSKFSGKKGNEDTKEERAEEKEEPTRDILTDKVIVGLIERPFVTLPLTAVAIISALFLGDWIEDTKKARLEVESQVEVTEKAVIAEVFNDYLINYGGEVTQPKEIVLTSPLQKDSFYKTSFLVNGVYHNDQTVYVTYLDKYDSDTLIPFDVSEYENLTINHYSDKDDVSTLSAIKLSEGLEVYVKDITTRRVEDSSLQDIDFIYNIKIKDKK